MNCPVSQTFTGAPIQPCTATVTGAGGLNDSVPVTYTGVVPDPFRAGREVIVDVRKQGSVYVGQPNSLVTKCPSKSSAAKKS